MATIENRYDPHNLEDVIGNLGVVVWQKDDEALIQWADRTETILTYREHYGWSFPDDNTAYQAGYAYAAGYRN